MNPVLGQGHYQMAFDWGPVGAGLVAGPGDVLVVVDVLSFTTSVSVAVERGTAVYPAPWRDERAAALAAEVGAELAVGRSQASASTPWSLSPAALRAADPPRRLVLPSPNGSSIAFAHSDSTVVAGCLRNADAVGQWLVDRLDEGRRVCVIAAGERWPDGSLRPAAEDALGAGAVLAAVLDRRPATSASPEARVTAATARAVGDVAGAVADCASGRELVAAGFRRDVDVAVEVDAAQVVPVLVERAFRAWG